MHVCLHACIYAFECDHVLCMPVGFSLCLYVYIFTHVNLCMCTNCVFVMCTCIYMCHWQAIWKEGHDTHDNGDFSDKANSEQEREGRQEVVTGSNWHPGQ